MRRMRVGLAVLVALGLGPVPAPARTFGQNQVQYPRQSWRVVESGHFRVCFRGGLDSLAFRVLDLAEKTDVVFTRRLGHPLSRRIPMILYGSGDDFAQTNVTSGPIGEGTGGFTAGFRSPVVLPFTGSYEELRHDVVHELARVFMFDLLRGGSASGALARQPFGAAPRWFTEGLAEYLSLGMESDAAMFLRDGIAEGTLPRLEDSDGWLVRPQGQSAVGYLVSRYGEERLRELLRRVRQSSSFGRAFQRAMGLPVRTFDEQWREWLRREYWPAVATRQDPERFARRLTDHRRDGGRLNTAPAISPQGDRVAWFSDRRQTTGVYLMSALDGKVLRRIVRGERDAQFEAVPSVRRSITWSVDGRRLGLTARRGGHDALCVVSVADGRVLKRIALDCDALADPAWSPVAESVVVVGLKDGRSDLWLVDVGTGGARQLTADTWDEREPCWTPDGRTVTFASDRRFPVVLQPERPPEGFGRYGLFDLDLASGSITRRIGTTGDDHSPAWSPDGRKLAFVSDRGGASDIMLYDSGSRSFTRLTDVLGGVSSLSWSRQDDRLVFSAFSRGGYDLFAVREPVSVDAVLARLRREMPQAMVSEDRDTLPVPPTRAPLPGRGGPFALPDSVLAQPPKPYRVRFSPDCAGGGVLAATGFGFVGSAALTFSDLLGDQRLTLAADLFGGPLEETNALLLYSYLPRRWDFTAGLFHFKNDRSARISGAEELLGGPRLFSERSFGVLFGASRPFDRFCRLELAFTQSLVERMSFEEDAHGEAARAGRRYQAVSAPALALVGDDAVWGSTGPVNGGRSDLAFSPSFGWSGRGLSCRTATLDARRYWSLAGGYTLAARALAGRSDGRDARTFFVGGFSTLRGFPPGGITGTRLAIVSTELRFPFIERFGAVGPVPLGRLDLRGALFADAGLVWDRGEPLRFTHVVLGERRLASPLASFGAGVRTPVGFIVAKVDAAWQTDLASVGRPRWEFSIGPEF